MKIFCVLIRKRIHEWTGAEISVFLNSDVRSQPKEMAIYLKSYYSALMGMLACTEKKGRPIKLLTRKRKKSRL